ncbi:MULTISPECIES: hypothetical protein [Bacillus cereus group]|uniref:hypothetical protein n=1 Tax=Bacillus cereus group TaxID=86661 RepID=UPI001A186D53|nr:hypothetical protein [Bacillus cereus group sp. N8]MED0889284.1 hypothetical protein [Bacillus mycoides]
MIQVEQLNLVFGLFGLAKAKNPPKKVLQGQNQKERQEPSFLILRVEIFECSFQKYNPFLAELLAFIYRVRRERVLKVV